MPEVALGAVAAVTASALFSVGLVLQSLEASAISPGEALRLSLVRRLLRRPRWLLGGALMIVGFGFHVGALTLAPLTVVQPSLAAGLLVLLALGARMDAAPVRARELAAVGAISLGVVGVTITAPARTTAGANAVPLALALGGLAIVALLPYALALVRGSRRAGGTLAALGAGSAYALTGLTTKLLSDGAATADWDAAAFWLVTTALAATLALVDQTMALQRRAATQVGVVIYVVPVVVPVLLAPLLVGEDWGSSPMGGVVLTLSLAVACAGTAVLAGSSSSSLEHP